MQVFHWAPLFLEHIPACVASMWTLAFSFGARIGLKKGCKTELKEWCLEPYCKTQLIRQFQARSGSWLWLKKPQLTLLSALCSSFILNDKYINWNRNAMFVTENSITKRWQAILNSKLYLWCNVSDNSILRPQSQSGPPYTYTERHGALSPYAYCSSWMYWHNRLC